MRQTIKSFATIVMAFSALMATSCGNHTASATGNTADATATPSAMANSTFSYKIDGQVYSWSGDDPLSNQATIDSNNEISFILMSNDPAEKNPPQFGFGIAASGSTVINWDNMDRFKSSGSNGGNHFANFRLSYPNGDGKFPDYEFGRASMVTVVITSKSDTRVAGTFSGDLINVGSQKPAQLTDGKFDLPLKRRKY